MTNPHEQLKGLNLAMEALSKSLDTALNALQVSKDAIESNQTQENKAIVNDAILKMNGILEKAKHGKNVDSDILEYSKELKSIFDLDKK